MPTMSLFKNFARVLLLASVLVFTAADSILAQARKSSPRPERKDSRSQSKKAKTPKESQSRNPRKISAAEKRQERKREQARESKPTVSGRNRKQSLAENRRAEKRRRAEAARQAAIRNAIERERARNEAMRERVQAMIAKDDLTGEDMEVRQVAVNALGNHAGTVVVMDPKTGRIYSIVNQEWAVREGFKPCSTIKLVTGIAGLNEEVINSGHTTRVAFKEAEFRQADLTRALAYSKNDYFQQVGSRVGFDKMVSYSRKFGLGEKTGINFKDEFAGRVPGADNRAGIYRMSSHGDSYQVTALQLATLVSAIANGGKLLTPYVARTRPEEFGFRPKVRRQIKLETETWRNILPGMVGSVNYGSGRRAHNAKATIAGKTGTCIEGGTWVGLFTSYAPLANPKLAVVVIAKGADARSHFPAAVAGRIYRNLNFRFGMPDNLQMADTQRDSAPARGIVTISDKETARKALPSELVLDAKGRRYNTGLERGLAEDEEDEAVAESSSDDASTTRAVFKKPVASSKSANSTAGSPERRPSPPPISLPVWRESRNSGQLKPVLKTVPVRSGSRIDPAIKSSESNTTPQLARPEETRPRRVSETQR